jgi:hypothetical protein
MTNKDTNPTLRYLLLFFAAICLLFPSKTWGDAQGLPKVTKYSWKGFQMEYPGSWKKDTESDYGKQRVIRISKTGTYPVIILLTISPHTQEPDKEYKERPSMAAFSYGFPIVKRFSGRKEVNDGLLSYNEVQLKLGPAAAAQIIIPNEKGGRYTSGHSFVAIKNNVMILGIVVTFGQTGQLIQNNEFHKATAEAYAILRSIDIK